MYVCVCTTNCDGDEINNNARESVKSFFAYIFFVVAVAVVGKIENYSVKERANQQQRNVEMQGTYTQSIHSVDFLFLSILYKPIFHIWLHKWYSISMCFFLLSFAAYYYLDSFFALPLSISISNCNSLKNESGNWSILLYDDQISGFFFSYTNAWCGAVEQSNNEQQ